MSDDTEIITKCVNQIKILCNDMITNARSGHPGMPMC